MPRKVIKNQNFLSSESFFERFSLKNFASLRIPSLKLKRIYRTHPNTLLRSNQNYPRFGELSIFRSVGLVSFCIKPACEAVCA
jgi:hypothetical protein